ncbi:MAG: hypothetical protein EXR72_03855 [Myxococcales bacterium]|nr:hypothetical protein [Myxococcales bacterium]
MRPICVLVVVLLSACGSESGGHYPGGAGDLGGAGRQCFGANDCRQGEICSVFGACVPVAPASDGGTTPPAEVAERPEPPASGNRYVYVALPTQDTVVKIDSQPGNGIPARTIAVGHGPAPLRTVPGQDIALVLNRGSNAASLIRARLDGGDDLVTLPTAPGHNQLAMSPDGRHAIAFFDFLASGGKLAPKQTFQEITVFALTPPGKEQAVRLSVGFRPSEVQFAPDGSAAWIITEQRISVLSLAQPPKPSIVPTVSLVKDPLTEPPPTGALVTRDGKLALARQPKLKGFRAVALDTGAITDVALPGEPTDLRLTPDGKLALLVLRDEHLVVFVDLPGDLLDPAKIEQVPTGDWTVGQAVITADGARALLFANAVNQKALLVADLKARQVKVLPLKKGVRQVLPSPDGRTAVILHNKTPGTPAQTDTLDEYLDKLQAYSLFDLQSGFAKLQPTAAPPGDVAFAPDARSAYLLLSDAGNAVRSALVLDLRSFLVHSVELGSPPVALGVVPMTRQVYVAQTHALGRLTFVATDTFKTRTLTGFALHGGIIE